MSSSRDLGSLDPRLQQAAAWLLSVATAYGIRYTITSVRRDEATQRKLYAAYRAGRSPLPAAPPGRSLHQYGRAFDVLFQPYPYYQRAFGQIWQQIGGRWSPGDDVHFEA